MNFTYKTTSEGQMKKTLMVMYASILLIVLAAVGLWMLKPFYIVNPGETALHLRLGKFIGANKESGWYTKYPIIDRIIFMNNRIRKSVIETTALSRDLQTVSIGVAINYQITDAIKLYQDIGSDFENVVIDPYAQESIKAIVAQYTAEDLIQYRHNAKDKVFTELKQRLLPLHIALIDFNFVHSDFSPDFIKAVEEKQIAQQSAMTSKNLSEKVKEEGIQVKTRADAEAYSLSVKRSSVTAELIELKKIEAQMKAIEKWDGRLPRVAGGATPFIDLGNSIA